MAAFDGAKQQKNPVILHISYISRRGSASSYLSCIFLPKSVHDGRSQTLIRRKQSDNGHFKGYMQVQRA